MTEPHPYDWTHKLAPIGKWQTAEGSFSAVMQSVMTIAEDGTGAVEYYEGDALRHTKALLWRFDSPGVLRLYVADDEFPLPESDDDWEDIPYKAAWQTTDLGRSPVLVNAGRISEWSTEERFWDLSGPIRLVEHPT